MTRPLPSTLPLKYREARRVLPYSGAFVVDNKAATLYASLERVGWEWTGKQWIRCASSRRALTAPQPPPAANGEAG